MRTGRLISLCFVAQGFFMLAACGCYLIALGTAWIHGAVEMTIFATVLGLITLIGGLVGMHANSTYEGDGNSFLCLWMIICCTIFAGQLYLQWSEKNIKWGLSIMMSLVFEGLYILTLLYTIVMLLRISPLTCGRNRNGYKTTDMTQKDEGNGTEDDKDPTTYELQDQHECTKGEKLMKERHPGIVKRSPRSESEI